MIRVGVIGTGIMGAGHARYLTNLVEGAEVTALSDIDLTRANALAEELKTVKLVTNDIDELINSPLVDAIIIVTPDPLHFEHLRKVLKTDKPTLCEKPIATTLEEAQIISDEIEAKLKATGKRQIVFGFMRRFDPTYQEIRELISSGAYGRPLYVRSAVRNVASPGITTPGLFTNMAIHDIDIFRWLFKVEWNEITSFYPAPTSNAPEGLRDPLIFIAKLSNGMIIMEDVVANSSYGYDTRTEIVCEKGSIEIGVHGDITKTLDFNFQGMKSGPMESNWMKKYEIGYINELKAWIKELETGVVNTDFATHKDALIANQVSAMGAASLK